MLLEKEEGKYDKWYFYCLILLAISLPFSKFGISVSQFLILIIWVIEGRFQDKWKALIANKLALALIAVYLLHAVGLAYTENFDYAFKDLRIKLPLFSFTVFASWIFPLNEKRLTWVLKAFLLSAVSAALISCYRVFFVSLEDMREASMFISHIRLALMISVAAFISIYLLIIEKQKWIYSISLLILLTSLVILQSMTGISLMIVSGIFISIYFILKSKNSIIRFGIPSLLILIFLGSAFFLYQEISEFYDVEEMGPVEDLPYTSPGGEIYYHKIESDLHENGNLIWHFLALKELERCWERKSNIGFREHDAKGQPMYSTIMRYMASKGLHKDSVDFQKLSAEEIRLIEQGHTNYRFVNEQGFSKRIYETLWEIENFRDGGNPEGNSLAQRAVFWSTGFEIFKENPWIGVGTGDLKQAFKEAYEKDNTELSERFRHRTHNQFLSIAITFGIFGFILFILAFFYPVWFGKTNFLLSLFLICAALSFIPEDTLETQIGISFIVFFYTLFGMNQISPVTQQSEYMLPG